MNREIKFRVWDKRSKTMIGPRKYLGWYDVLSPYDPFTIARQNINDDYLTNDSEKWLEWWRKLLEENFITMQFTGIQDKNNKDIYEGDLIRVNSVKITNNEVKKDDSYVLQIFYSEIEAAFKAATPKGVREGVLGGNLIIYSSIEVIGNVFENPELLK